MEIPAGFFEPLPDDPLVVFIHVATLRDSC